MFTVTPKYLDRETLSEWRKSLSGTLVLASGCFDLIHAGHVQYLQTAKNMGDRLLVALNEDDSIRKLKGAGRPVHPLGSRLLVISAFECVDYVTHFPELRVAAILRMARPDVWVKGTDYSLSTLDKSERDVAAYYGIDIRFIPLMPGHSTTGILQTLACSPTLSS